MKRDKIINIIKNEGFTDYQAITIYDEMNCSQMETEEEIIDAANEWFETEKRYEKCMGY